MLEIVEYGKDEYGFPALVVLGCFDAIHAGHRELLKKAKLQAKINGLDLGVMMFKEGKSGKLIYSFEERCAFLEQYNVKFVLAVDFNEEFKKIAPLDFLSVVEDKVNVKAYMSGKDFRFGANAKGKSSTLKNYSEDEENGVWYMPVKDVDLNGEKISTTLIKSCLDDGNVAKANSLLGSEFSVSGEVVKGEGRGTSVVGFPTVNIVYPEWKHTVKHGVYNVKCLIGETDYQGIANFGNCPTFGDDRIALEVYLEGFSGDLYGQVLTIRFIDFIREIEEFASAEELSGQLQSDLSSVSDEFAVTDGEQAVETVAENAEEHSEEVASVEIIEQPEETVVEEEVNQSDEVVAQSETPVVEEAAVQTEEVVFEEATEVNSDDGFDDAAETVETVETSETEETLETENDLGEEQYPEVTGETVTEEPTENITYETTEEIAADIPEVMPEEIAEQTFIEGVSDGMHYSEGEELTASETEEENAAETENIQTENGEQLDFTDVGITETVEVTAVNEQEEQTELPEQQVEQTESAETETEADEAETDNNEASDGESD